MGKNIMSNHEVHVKFAGKIVMVGFGSIGQGVLPLILRHIGTSADRITIVTAEDAGRAEAEQFGVKFVKTALTRDNYRQTLLPLLGAGDFLLNLSVDVSSVALILLARERGALYLDTCIEPWAGGYVDPKLTVETRSNYIMRIEALALRDSAENAPTAVLTHGANPGLVSHLVKQALLNIAKDTGVDAGKPASREQWAKLAQTLGIKVIHIAERDTQVANVPKKLNEFVNTWSVDGFVSEGAQPAELGWGTHERHFPGGRRPSQGRVGLRDLFESPRREHSRAHLDAEGRVLSRLSDHAFRGDFARGLLHRAGGRARGVPPDHALCLPSERQRRAVRARIRRAQLASAGREANHAPRDHRRHRRARRVARGTREERLLVRLPAIDRGGAPIGALQQCDESASHRRSPLRDDLGDGKSPARDRRAGRNGAIERPLGICMPYLGTVVGEYTDWTPLHQRGELFAEDLDTADPWQFKNIRVV